jgi:ABC-2 type transport system permease protein
MKDMLVSIMPGMMYFWVLFVAQIPLQEILHERESRLLPRLLASPVRPIEYLASKLLRSCILSSLALALLLICTALLFKVHWGSFARVTLTVAAWSLSMTGLLAFICGAARSREQAQVITPLVLMLAGMLGGGMFPFENLPPVLRMLGQNSPVRWAVLTMQAAAGERPFGEVFLPCLLLVILGVSGTILGFVLFKRHLNGGARK